LFDGALRINYWRNGRVELRPPLGRAHFCVTGIRAASIGPCGATSGPDSCIINKWCYLINIRQYIEFDGRGLPNESNHFGQNEPKKGFCGALEKPPGRPAVEGPPAYS